MKTKQSNRVLRINNDEIVAAIEKAKEGIAKYISIMELFYSVDVTSDANFKRRYNAFYRIRQKSSIWYENYFQLMEELKGTHPSFAFVLMQLKSRLAKYEPSFSSKLVATLDPTMPVWDKHVLRNTGHRAPPMSSSTRHADTVACYESIQEWYRAFVVTDEAKTWVRLFDENVTTHYKISGLKKVDFVMWQTRDDCHGDTAS